MQGWALAILSPVHLPRTGASRTRSTEVAAASAREVTDRSVRRVGQFSHQRQWGQFGHPAARLDIWGYLVNLFNGRGKGTPGTAYCVICDDYAFTYAVSAEVPQLQLPVATTAAAQ